MRFGSPEYAAEALSTEAGDRLKRAVAALAGESAVSVFVQSSAEASGRNGSGVEGGGAPATTVQMFTFQVNAAYGA